MTALSCQTYLEDMFSMVEETNYYNKRGEIATFYSGKKIFITGGLGFFGTLLVEKLLRCCPEVTMIYFLIRAKKQKDTQTRFKEYLNDVIFDRLKREQKDFEKKFVLIEGDISKMNLGLSEIDRERIKDTNVIFHSAASVRFLESIRMIVNTNVRGTRDLLLLAQEMPNLRAFVYISTAYSQCVYKKIEEKFYEPPLKTEDIIKLTEILSDDQLETITPKLIGEWPNTYVYTKAICEDAVRQYSNGIPTCIVRPSIVTPTEKEPIAGWTNNMNGLTGVILGAALGVLHVLYGFWDHVCDIVPADYTINNIIVAGWDIAQKQSIRQNIDNFNKEHKPMPIEEEIPIFNYISSVQNPINYRSFEDKVWKNGPKNASPLVFWYYSFSIESNYYIVVFWEYLVHWAPAYIVDSLLYITGRKPKLLKIYRKIHKFSHVINYFTKNQWEFTNDNVVKLWDKLSVVDKHNFFFNISDLDWNHYFEVYVKGVRVHFLKDPMETMEKGNIHYRKLKIAHYTLKTLFYSLIFWIFYSLLRFLFTSLFSF